MQRDLAYRYIGGTSPTFNRRAINELTAGLGGLDGKARQSEWAAEYAFHLAVAHAQGGQFDEACVIMRDIIATARRTCSTRLLTMTARFHARLAAKWPGHPDLGDLAEVLR